MLKMVFIGLLVFFAAACTGIGFFMYRRMKKTLVNGEPLMNQPVNEQTRTDKMGAGELLVYGSIIIVAALIVVLIMQEQAGGGSAILAKAVLLPPVMALFNARKRTGKAMLALVIAFMVSLFLMLANALIGLPQKAPLLVVDHTPITAARTTAKDLIDSGCDIYIRRSGAGSTVYNELLTSGNYVKYPIDQSVRVEKGFHPVNDSVENAKYILVKEGLVLGSIELYGGETEDTVLEDSKIIGFKTDEDCIAAAKEKSLSYKLNGMELLTALKKEKVKKTFDRNIWSIPDKDADVTQLFYGLKWGTNSDHLFWNEYYATISFDKENKMTSFELFVEIARE